MKETEPQLGGAFLGFPTATSAARELAGEWDGEGCGGERREYGGEGAGGGGNAGGNFR